MTVAPPSEGLVRSALGAAAMGGRHLPPCHGERLEGLKRMQYADNAIAEQVPLPPEPRTTAWAEWPAQCRLWLLKAGLCGADLPGLGACYTHPLTGSCWSFLTPSRGLLFWQARAVDERLPKYMAPPVDKSQIVPRVR